MSNGAAHSDTDVLSDGVDAVWKARSGATGEASV
jgi:hypothetical protein